MIKLGLERVRRALALLGHPEEAFSSVIVAGTNGKGSVSSLTASAARAAGLKTGHFTSPHLVDVRERVRVDGRKIPARAWSALSRRIDDLSRRRRLGLTEFERQTLLAVRHFADEKVSLAVMEVGLGGRLDAVNALPAVEAAVITSIGHDHQAWLGPTLRHVYGEKRGVARAGIPLVQSVPPALLPVGRADFAARGVPVWTLGREIRLTGSSVDWAARRQCLDVSLPGAALTGLTVGLLGAHQARNAALAAALCIQLRRRGWPFTDEAIRNGFSAASWPGRFQVLPGRPAVILDGAHNREAIDALAAAFRSSPWGSAPATLLFGCLQDKEAGRMLARLKPLVRRAVLTTLPTPRSRPASALATMWGRGKEAECVSSPREGLRRALARGETVLVTGSLYLVGEVLRILRKVPA